MLYLIDNPVVREAFFPSGTQPLAVEPAAETDAGAIASIAGKHEVPTRPHSSNAGGTPETFSVVRDRDGTVAGFSLGLRGAPAQTIDRRRRSHPRGVGAISLSTRSRKAGSAHSAAGSTPTRAKVLRDPGRRLARRQAHLHGAAPGAPAHVRRRPRRADLLARGREARLPTPPRLRSRARRQQYASVVLDFGPGSVDGWLASSSPTSSGSRRTRLDEERALAVDGKPVPLTPLEYGSSAAARARGKTVTRRELCARSGGRSSPAEATSSTRQFARFGASSGPRRSSSRPCAVAATACARLARAPELEHSPNFHQAFIERVGGAPTLDA